MNINTNMTVVTYSELIIDCLEKLLSRSYGFHKESLERRIWKSLKIGPLSQSGVQGRYYVSESSTGFIQIMAIWV